LLPKAAFAGASPIHYGEVMLQELEDKEETCTQLFFNVDGTVSHGATDGPPTAGFCGLWQCGSEQFQMTLSRSFSAPSATLGQGMRGRMADDVTYTVTRVYEGAVDAQSAGGVGVVTGRIDMVSEEDVASWATADATSIAALHAFANVQTPAIGYFVLDANTITDLNSLPSRGLPSSRPPTLGPGYPAAHPPAHTSRTLMIFVKTRMGKSTTLEVSSSDSVDSVKAKIEEQQGIAASEQRLSFGGMQLEDGRALSDYAIEEGSILQVMFGATRARDKSAVFGAAGGLKRRSQAGTWQ
jgi:hypothetical protein